MAYPYGLIGGSRPKRMTEEERLQSMAVRPIQVLPTPMPQTSTQTPPPSLRRGDSAPVPAPTPVAPGKGGLIGSAAPRKRPYWRDLASWGSAAAANMSNQNANATTVWRHHLDARNEEDALQRQIEGMGISDPTELAFARANPRDYLAQRFGDVRDQERYDRARSDEVADATRNRSWQVEDRDLGMEYRESRDEIGDRRYEQEYKDQRGDVAYSRNRQAETDRRYSFINPGNGTVVRANPNTGEYETIVSGPSGGRSQPGYGGAPQTYGQGGEFIRTGIGADGRYAPTDGDPEVGSGGLPPPRFNTLDLTTPGAGGTLIQKEDARMAQMREAKDTALRVKQLSDKFVEIAGDADWQGEGPIADVGQWWSSLTDGRKTQLQQINNELAPAMRQAGSGAMSDKDVEMYKSSVVHFNNRPEGNAEYAYRANAAANRVSEYYAFMQSYRAQYGPGSLQEAERYWSQYADAVPVFDDYGNVNEDAISSYEFFTGRAPPVNPYNRKVGALQQQSAEEMSDEDILKSLGIQ